MPHIVSYAIKNRRRKVTVEWSFQREEDAKLRQSLIPSPSKKKTKKRK